MAAQTQSAIPLSDTVKTTLAAFPDAAIPITAWMLVRGALTFHDEYGNYLAKRIVSETGPGGGIAKIPSQWLDEVVSLFDPTQVKEIHGRLFILGLCELDAELARFLDNFGFRDALKREIREPYDSLLQRIDPNVVQSAHTPEQTQTVSGTPPPPPSSDYIIFRADAATDVDQLGRAGFADALATWLNRIWGENYTAYAEQLQEAYETETPLPQTSSFIVHLHGPWGAGKTSLLRLMEKALRNTHLNIGGRPHTWTVVWFNAWRNRQIEPVWWPPMDRVYRELVRSPSTNLGFWAWETWWRLGVNGLGENPLVLGLGIVALFGLFFWLTGSASSDSSWLASLQSIGGIIGLAGTLGAGILTLSRSLFTASSAQNFTRLAQDPMEKVRTHFREMMDRANHPIMVFIDDLDRCQPEYVVRLLESLQTLFNDPRVFYVIAADRRWLYECFEIVYKDFKTTVREPGRRTGYLFLEKIFQMSISVPAMSEDTQKAYLDFLYRGKKAEVEERLAEATRQAEAEFRSTTTQTGLVRQLEFPPPNTAQDLLPLVQQVRREAAVRQLASQALSTDIEHFLLPFAPLLERNPRAMKRLVNAYSIYLALAMLADIQLINSEEKKKRFALWTILSLRWPALAEKLENNPETLHALLEKKADGLDPDLAALVQDEEVQRLLHGEAKGVGVALDVETIERLWGLQANTSTPVVA